jgi:hypothetical protein
MPTVHGATRRALACLLLLALAACTRAEAAPMGAPQAAAPLVAPRHEAMAIIDRLGTAEPTPTVTGQDIGGAARVLHAAGATVQVVAFSEEETVTAQYPSAGEPLPTDGVVTVWTGTPPVPPPAPAQPAPEPISVPAVLPAVAEPSPADDDGIAAPPPTVAEAPLQPAPAPPADAGAPSTGSGSTPGLVPPSGPPPPRASIRTMAPAPAGTVLEGLASWYGPGFAGRTTACGGTFDPEALTLASRELRCGTVVRVTGPSGATVEATVTDWGPAEWTERRFDLSAATFAAIHHPGAGVVAVRVEVLGP